MSVILALSILFIIILMYPVVYKIGFINGHETMRTSWLPNMPEKSLIPSIIADNTPYPRASCGA